ncbi:hypothetical protein HF086_011238 [Spodoptera exigua]|uniref:Serine hydroxymethyltransferase n=1 Tax=Spodoptera exigua TaxID=7107 RepID=A0A922MH21_SPOEX|nr:hypothetical protein HF086_011238 [Spodoptera exigua]
MSNSILNGNLWDTDPELYAIIKNEKERQRAGLEMIASENFTSIPVLQCLSTCLHNKYSEGMPNQRLNAEEWGVNVQPYSGSPANFAVYTGVVEPHGRIMGLDLPDGGHLTHGFFTATKKISATSIFFESMPYKVDPKTGFIDYDKLAETARLFKPRLIIAGVIPSPFEYCDIVTTTTHKTLRGPRAGVIFYRKGVRSVKANGQKVMYDLESKINQSVFPGLQGGPHNHAIAAIATAMKQATTSEFVEYQKQVVKNAQRLCKGLMARGYEIATGGTEVHLILVDMRSAGLTGAPAERILELCSIACNKNTVPGDKSALHPSGIRLGTPALTTRGMKEADIDRVVDYIDKALKLAQEITKVSGPKVADFNKTIEESPDFKAKIKNLKEEIENYSRSFPLPGFETY